MKSFLQIGSWILDRHEFESPTAEEVGHPVAPNQFRYTSGKEDRMSDPVWIVWLLDGVDGACTRHRLN